MYECMCSTHHFNWKSSLNLLIKIRVLDFLGGTVGKNLTAHAGDMGLIPAPRRSHMPWCNWAQAPQILSPCSRACEPQLLSLNMAITKAWAPRACAPQWRVAPTSLCKETKTQHYQKKIIILEKLFFPYVWKCFLKICCESVSHSVVSDSAIPWTVAHHTPLSMECVNLTYKAIWAFEGNGNSTTIFKRVLFIDLLKVSVSSCASFATFFPRITPLGFQIY